MSTQYDGIPSNIAPLLAPGLVAIQSSTNTSPIVVTTVTPHELTTGDDVFIAQHLVNTNADADWTVTVIDPTTISLDGSVGNGVGGATGFVQSMVYGITYAIPSDGDGFDAAAWNVACEALGDRTAYNFEKLFWRRRLYGGGTSQIDNGGKETFFGGSILEVFGQNRVSSPVVIPDQHGSALTIDAVGGQYYQIRGQSNNFNLTLRVSSAPAAVDGDWVTLFKPGNDGHTISVFSEGLGAATVFIISGTVTLRFDSFDSKWKVVGAGTIDPALMSFSNPF